MSRKVELLAPAGNYESFIGAINAGADAVYVGGDKFSARAYADNFDTETLCQCIQYAHLFGKRVYLTLNTLIKENEFEEIYDYVKPFYLAGIDGVIIQDFGVLKFLKEHFPYMELHASTQMAVTGSEFVELCKEFGISRVVPARELSLSELKKIREAGIEVECFIHGAMCYCYSGMCLMSSILGGRSGNRGRCAQPCRLPYQVSVDGKFSAETHTLSLKDMCTIEHIPELIKAGMDSFKIEGRMKRSEYAAGVTALYRKYIDAYYKNPEKKLRISSRDKYVLEHLYMRSELHDGYMFKHNGSEMVTKDAPSYNGLDEEVLEEIREKYIGYTKKIPVSMYGYFEVGQESVLTVCTEEGISVTVTGPKVEMAQKASATFETVSKQLAKFGNTHFELHDIDISIQGETFLPNGVLNALRREALEQLQEEIIKSYFPKISKRKCIEENERVEKALTAESIGDKTKTQNKINLSVLIKNREQLDTLVAHKIIQKTKAVYLEDQAMEAYLSGGYGHLEGVDIIYAMPYILRAKDISSMEDKLVKYFRSGIKHVLVRNVESLSLLKKMQCSYDVSIITDASLYCWNQEAKKALLQYAEKVTLPLELNAKELRGLREHNTEQIIYGYIPLMITANCVYKTNAVCQISSGKEEHSVVLKDRYGKFFPVLTNCKYCYNTIYNSVPLSLHKKYNKSWLGSCRLQFSTENSRDMQKILNYYDNWVQDNAVEFPVAEYTTAHENRQVE